MKLATGSHQRGLSNFEFNVSIHSSQSALKVFKMIRGSVPEGEITLTYLSSWLIKQSFNTIGGLLDGLCADISSNSQFYQNLREPKSFTPSQILA